ncbi:hypothetical protein PACTADRAFT_33539 [Pachysolen tannophilus NRRL Y-2460]|uniref:N-acetyltransferase domain-containing protein n=1 Tax=Pachysolen tannophilus NRRL Y-2460 TaxID=669874 RepID=A0A1E4TX93_PACTA|nr:hypothetical protein PACTADRAFT_33539 [Pachysolen tannophilus NRRL Y-2460]
MPSTTSDKQYKVTISLDDLTPNNLGVLRKITEKVLPTSYPQQFYHQVIESPSTSITKLAYFNEVPVGCLKAQVLIPEGKTLPSCCYVDSLCVIKAYRKFGIGQQLLDYLEQETIKKFIHTIKLHCWVENKPGVEWYLKNGFQVEEIVKDYYKEQELVNPDAMLLVKTI